MKKQIAIMTWYSYINYGTALQASALYKKIEEFGYKPVIIKYVPRGGIVEQQTFSGLVIRVKNKVKEFFNPSCISKERKELFLSYIKSKMTETNVCNTYPELKELNRKYDAFVCGSDQIWSPLCYDDKYFLSFVENIKRMISYAPSIGTSSINNSTIREKMSKQLNRFIHLSVREEEGAQIIESLTGKKAEVVLDPTLLLSSDEWDKYANVSITKKIDCNDYIICYFLGDFSKYNKYVNELSRVYNMPIYVIPIKKRQKIVSNVVPFEVGPEEFVSLIKNARHVCTDSFHGIAFSIIYNVPFTAFKRFADGDERSQNSRVYNILKMLKLEHRLVDYSDMSKISVLKECDYTNANEILDVNKKLSEKYLENALKEATDDSNKSDMNQCYKITDLCCGCGACSAVCTKQAIEIKLDSQGFQHYEINFEKCVRCGLCKNICPFNNISAIDLKEAKGLYAIKSNSQQTLKESSSGGVGYEIASLLSQSGSWIAGCIYDNKINNAYHVLIEPQKSEEIRLFQGSKYIQSKSSMVMKQILEKCEEKQMVFFGTPCQVAALDKLLSKHGNRQNVLLVDLICHGVPSYYLWSKHLKEIEKKYLVGNNPQVLFRDKSVLKHRRFLSVIGNKRVYKKDEIKDNFYAFFRRGLCDMETCYDCPYRERSAADIRMGDYWGERFENDKTGVSMVIVNTFEGKEIIKKLEQLSICGVQEYDINEYWEIQYPYNRKKPIYREELIEQLKQEEVSLTVLRKKYCRVYDIIEAFWRIISRVKRILH